MSARAVKAPAPRPERTSERCGCQVLWHPPTIDIPACYSVQRCTLHDSALRMTELLWRIARPMPEKNLLRREILTLLTGLRKDVL